MQCENISYDTVEYPEQECSESRSSQISRCLV